MAKIAFSKLKTKVDIGETIFRFNGEEIAVKTYLPLQEKLGLIGTAVSQSYEEDRHYFNPIKLRVFLEMEVVYAYTNISFTEKQKEDFVKLYDNLSCSGLLAAILENLPENEWASLYASALEAADALYTYHNSAVGIVDALQKQYNTASFDIAQLEKTITALSETPFVQNILPLMNS